MENSLRKELHEMIDDFPDEKLQEVYALLQDDEYPDEMKQMLDEEYEDYIKNGEVVLKEEVDKIVSKLLYNKE